jgi:hypothetical protein
MSAWSTFEYFITAAELEVEVSTDGSVINMADIMVIGHSRCISCYYDGVSKRQLTFSLKMLASLSTVRIVVVDSGQ